MVRGSLFVVTLTFGVNGGGFGVRIWMKVVVGTLAAGVLVVSLIVTSDGHKEVPAQMSNVDVESDPPATTSVAPVLLSEERDEVFTRITADELQDRLPYDVYISKLNLDQVNAEGAALYIYYFENGEMNALRTVLQATTILKEHYPRLGSIVFHVWEAREFDIGYEPVGGLGLIMYRYDSTGVSDQIEMMSDAEVKEIIREQYIYNAVEFDVSVFDDDNRVKTSK